MNNIEKTLPQSGGADDSEFTHGFVQTMTDYIKRNLVVKTESMSDLLADETPETVRHSFQFFREFVGPLIYKAPFADRVYRKPLGYAGDYEMMNFIYRNKPEGQDLFSKCLHYCFIKEPSAEAVRSRADLIAEQIGNCIKQSKKGHLKIASVGSGGAVELAAIVELAKKYEKSISIELFDQDEEALKYAQRGFKRVAKDHESVSIAYNQENIKNIIMRGLKNEYDIIYSAGLFDYLTDPVAQIAVQTLFKNLSDQGCLLIGNFDVTNPNKMTMTMTFDWNLIHRTKEELNTLFGGIGDKIEILAEKTGINLFCKITKQNGT